MLTWSGSFLPIVILALVFNITNAVGFTYALVSLYDHDNNKVADLCSRVAGTAMRSKDGPPVWLLLVGEWG